MPFGEQYIGTAQDTFVTGVAASDEATDMKDFWAREFHSIQGRWLTPDPAGVAAVDPKNPQTWNRYAYVLGNPLAFIDPRGLCHGEMGTNGLVDDKPGRLCRNQRSNRKCTV
jgi:RHS repeat-associated protein